MKKTYCQPTLEVVMLNATDLISTSGDGFSLFDEAATDPEPEGADGWGAQW